MSLISDALQKAQQERELPRAVSAVSYPPRARSTSRTSSRSPAARGGWSFTLLLAAACVALVLFAFRARWQPLLARPSAPPVATATSPAPRETAAIAATGVPPSPSPVPPAEPVATDDYELAGISSLGASTLLSVSRRRDHRSFWIPVGRSAGGISVVSYQPETERAVIRVHDRLLRIGLRDGYGGPLPASGVTE